VGIQSSYLDTSGKRQHAAPETLAAILQLWEINALTSKEIHDALTEFELNRWRKIVNPVIVAWNGETTKIELLIPAASEKHSAEGRIRLEDGQSKSFTARFNNLRTLRRSRVSGVPFVAKELLLPVLPHGYHQLSIDTSLTHHASRITHPGRTATALIISAPTKSYSVPGRQKSWGAFLPMYAAHSRESWGAGNFGDWQKLTDWLASLGGEVASTLPLLAAFLEHPVCEPSPYSPASRLFWNEFYLDIPTIPEFSGCRAAQKHVRSNPFQQQLDRFRQSPLIDYPAQMAARRQVLEHLARFFFKHDSPRQKQFYRFLKSRPQVEDYAQFRAACDQTHLPWQKWPQRQRDGNLRTGDYSEAAKNYHLYIQWLTHEQVAALTRKCGAHGSQFYLDLPLGVHSAGYDLWRERDVFAGGASVGAPPDAFFNKGQNWGFTPLHPQRLREQSYSYLREVLRFQMRHTGMLRLDHVMSLHRLYWIPEGCSAREGAYVSYPAEEIYAILSLESHRHKTVLVGENLGTVPEEVNKAMNRHGLRRMYVVQFAQRPNPRSALAKPPRGSVASLNTHDMPTFAAHWRGLDIDDRRDLGLFTNAETLKEHARRAKLNLALEKFLNRKGWLKKSSSRDIPDRILRACLEWLRSSPAELVLINLEDLWGEDKPQNVPGTSSERPNWRRKARCSTEELRANDELCRFLRGFGTGVYTK